MTNNIGRKSPRRRPRVLFICGNHNHNTMMHAVAREMPDCERWFTPYYCDDWSAIDFLRMTGILEFVALGHDFRKKCLRYLHQNRLGIDLGGKRGGYDLVLTCSDLIVPTNLGDSALVGVQEGMIDPPLFWYRMRQRFPWLPRWAAGTACTGVSNLYDKYCLASEGYREDFAARGAKPDKLVVTGLPNYDDFGAYVKPGHWIEGQVLACTSDGRETFRRDDRQEFIKWAQEIAAGRPLVFKFHPNEKMSRAIAEVEKFAPGARYVTTGRGEELAANCATLITEWSTLAYVGLALGIPTYSYRDLERHKGMIPIQNKSGAKNIANVCRQLLVERGVMPAASVESSGFAVA
jgi:hypothetical protein